MLALGAAGLTLVFQAVFLRLTFEVICQMPEEKHETTTQTKAAGLKTFCGFGQHQPAFNHHPDVPPNLIKLFLPTSNKMGTDFSSAFWS